MTKDEQISNALSDAGVGKRWHRVRLAEYGLAGAELGKLAVVPADFRRWVDEGGSLLLYGKESFGLTMSYARACILNGVGAKVMSIDELVSALTDAGEELRMYEIGVLIVVSVYASSWKECPLTLWQRLRVQTFLMNRINNLQPVALQARDNILMAPPDRWWSSDFIACLEENFKSISVDVRRNEATN